MVDVVTDSRAALATNSTAKGFDRLLSENQDWWRDVWARSFIRMSSEDGVADEIERNYTYFLYVMASASRGEWPARFGGILWYTNGDMRAWGSLYWWANQSCYYNGWRRQTATNFWTRPSRCTRA